MEAKSTNEFSVWLSKWGLESLTELVQSKGIRSSDDFKYIKSQKQFDKLIHVLGDSVSFIDSCKLEDAWRSIAPMTQQQQAPQQTSQHAPQQALQQTSQQTSQQAPQQNKKCRANTDPIIIKRNDTFFNNLQSTKYKIIKHSDKKNMGFDSLCAKFMVLFSKIDGKPLKSTIFDHYTNKHPQLSVLQNEEVDFNKLPNLKIYETEIKSKHKRKEEKRKEKQRQQLERDRVRFKIPQTHTNTNSLNVSQDDTTSPTHNNTETDVHMDNDDLSNDDDLSDDDDYLDSDRYIGYCSPDTEPLYDKNDKKVTPKHKSTRSRRTSPQSRVIGAQEINNRYNSKQQKQISEIKAKRRSNYGIGSKKRKRRQIGNEDDSKNDSNKNDSARKKRKRMCKDKNKLSNDTSSNKELKKVIYAKHKHNGNPSKLTLVSNQMFRYTAVNCDIRSCKKSINIKSKWYHCEGNGKRNCNLIFCIECIQKTLRK